MSFLLFQDSDEASDDSDVDWEADSSSSSSSDDEAEGGLSQLKGRALWLKKTVSTKKKENKVKSDKPKATQDLKKAARLAAEALTATKSVIPAEGLTPSILDRKVKELAAQRGRRGKDNRQLLRELEALSHLSLKFGPRVEVPILMYVISAQFGLQRTMEDFMDTLTWKACAGYLQRIADVVDEGYTLSNEAVDESDLFLSSGGHTKMKAAANAADGAMAAVAADEKLVNPHTGEAETQDERAERLRLEKEKAMTAEEKKVIPVVGSLALHLSRLEEEYTKSLQRTSHHSQEYITRLRDESKLVELLARFQSYFEKQSMPSEAAALAQLRVEHLYYRHDSIAREVDKAALFNERFGDVAMLHPSCHVVEEAFTGPLDFNKIHPGAVQGKPSIQSESETDFAGLISDLCKYVYKHGTDQAKMRAVICHVYHHAIHDRFLDARDLLLMSHLQDKIHDCGDTSTMIMFNRMMVNIGMCAFRLGRIYDAHQCLADICSVRVRELLAQGVTMGRFNEKSAEQEKAEKRRQVPYHQHINLDLLEACHLISAMLLEVPNMAGEASNRRGRVVSRTFRKYHDQYNHQVFTGPPEQTRDFVMCAAKHLMKGEWQTCAELVSNLDVWQLVAGEDAAKKIGKMLTEKVKLEGLRTYLFAFSTQYDSMSLAQLCAMFEMTKNEVHSVVSKMMINRELYASWDQPTETIVLQRVEPSALQVMALQFAEKAGVLMETNERLLDAQTGGHGFKDDHWRNGDGDDRWQGRGGNQRGHQRGGRGGRGGGNQRGGNQRGGGFQRGKDRNQGRRTGGGRGGGRGGDKNRDRRN